MGQAQVDEAVPEFSPRHDRLDSYRRISREGCESRRLRGVFTGELQQAKEGVRSGLQGRHWVLQGAARGADGGSNA